MKFSNDEENPFEEICPNCGQYLGGESICPNCGDTMYDEEGLNEYEDEDELGRVNTNGQMESDVRMIADGTHRKPIRTHS